MSLLAHNPKSINRSRSRPELDESILEERLKIANVILPEDNLEDLVQLRIAPELVSRRLRARRVVENQSSTIPAPRTAPSLLDYAYTPPSSSENDDSGSSNEPRAPIPLPVQPLSYSPTPNELLLARQQHKTHTLDFNPSSNNLPENLSHTLFPELDVKHNDPEPQQRSSPTLGKIPSPSNLPTRIPSSRLRSISEANAPVSTLDSIATPSSSSKSPIPETPSRFLNKGPLPPSPKGPSSPSQPPPTNSPRPKTTLHQSPLLDDNLSSRRVEPQASGPRRERTSTQTSLHSAHPKPRLGRRGKASPGRNTSTPLNPHRKQGKGRPRSLSASSISQMMITDTEILPPWSTDPSPRLYRVDPKSSADAEPGHDDLILPTVARQLEAQQKARSDFLAEQNKKGASLDISQWDPVGTPVLVRKITPPSEPPPLPVVEKTPEALVAVEEERLTPQVAASSSRISTPVPRPLSDDRPIRPAQVSNEPEIDSPDTRLPSPVASPVHPAAFQPQRNISPPLLSTTPPQPLPPPLLSPPGSYSPPRSLRSPPGPTSPPLVERPIEFQDLRINDHQQHEASAPSAGCCRSCTIM